MKIIELEKEEFDSIAKSHPYATAWQTSNFGEAAKVLGYTPLYVGFDENNDLKGCALILTKIEYLGLSISYAPRGILIDYEDEQLLEIVLKKLKDYLNDRKIMSFTMDPPIIMSIRNKKGEKLEQRQGIDHKLDNIMHGGEALKANTYAEDIRNTIMKKANFEYRGENLYFEGILPRWYATITLPINAKKLLSKIDKRVRNKLRKAIKLGVEILKDETKNIDLIADILKQDSKKPIEFYKQFIENNENCEIYIARLNSEKYVNNSKILYEREIDANEMISRIIQEKNRLGKNIHKSLNQKMESDKIINSYKEHLVKSTETLKEYPNGKVVAMCIVTKNGNNVEIFEEGALKEHEDTAAMSLLRWKILEHYSNTNYRAFIFGAITGEFDKKKNRMYGLNQAKLSLNGKVLEYIGEFGIMTNRPMYNLYLASVRERTNFKI